MLYLSPASRLQKLSDADKAMIVDIMALSFAYGHVQSLMQFSTMMIAQGVLLNDMLIQRNTYTVSGLKYRHLDADAVERFNNTAKWLRQDSERMRALFTVVGLTDHAMEKHYNSPDYMQPGTDSYLTDQGRQTAFQVAQSVLDKSEWVIGSDRYSVAFDDAATVAKSQLDEAKRFKIPRIISRVIAAMPKPRALTQA